MIMCATRSSRCTLASTNVGRTLRKLVGATNICGWRPRPASGSGASGPLAHAKRKYPAAVQLPDAVQLEDVQKFLPEGCRMGIDRLDRSWRLSAWGHRTPRAWNQYGAKGSAELFIKLAWETALAKGYADQCVCLLASFGLSRGRQLLIFL